MIVRVGLDRVERNPFQTRVGEPVVDGLAASIADLVEVRPGTSGLIHVPVGRLVVDGQVVECQGDVLMFLEREPGARVQLAAGHRRWAAFAQLCVEGREEFGTFPVDVMALADESMADIVQVENDRREDISPIEEALLIEQAIERFGWSQSRVGKRWGITQSAVSNKLRLLKLPELLQGYLNRGWLTERHGRALVPLATAGVRASKLGKLAQRKRSGKPEGEGWFLSVAELEAAIKEFVRDRTFGLPWALDWEPEGEGSGPCNGCKALLRIGRKIRCGNRKRFDARVMVYRVQVEGPRKAVELFGQFTGWTRKEPINQWLRCECCQRNQEAVGDLGNWYTASWRRICTECWRRAGLEEPVEAVEVGRPVPVVAGGGPTSVSTSDGGDGVAVAPVMVPVESVVPPRPPATVVTLRILGECNDAGQRAVLVGLATEGGMPKIRRCWYDEMLGVASEMCVEHFAGNGDISQEIVAEGVAEVGEVVG